MTWAPRWTAVAVALVAAAALPGGQRGPAPAEAGQRPITCVTFALPAVLSGTLSGAAPVPIIPSVVPSPVLPITSPGPVTTVPDLMLLTPHPATGAYVVPVITTMPSAPGASVTRPEVLIPPVHVPGQSRSAVVAGLVQAALGPAGSAGSTTPLVVCY